MLCDGDNKSLSQCDTLAQLIGKILIAVRGDNGYRFSARLIELRGEGAEQECWFQTKAGQTWMIRRGNLSDISELRPRGRP